MQSIAYECADCNTKFRIEISEAELTGRLAPNHPERCPNCGQSVGRGRVNCPKCGHTFELDLPHWHVYCDLAMSACPKCGAEYRSLCIC
jgi:DNA-directed RNA polymerase subunit RPC12/RpoP